MCVCGGGGGGWWGGGVGVGGWGWGWGAKDFGRKIYPWHNAITSSAISVSQICGYCNIPLVLKNKAQMVSQTSEKSNLLLYDDRN